MQCLFLITVASQFLPMQFKMTLSPNFSTDSLNSAYSGGSLGLRAICIFYHILAQSQASK
jgi:hypothetical protein